MARSFYYGTDSEVYTGSNSFSAKINLTPAAYGLSAPQAAAYGTKNDAYADAYLAAIDPATRTKSKVAAKNDAKAELMAMAADLAKIIDGTPTVTDEQKIDLGLNVRETPSPIPVPEDPPVLEITERIGTRVTFRLHDGTGGAKPDGVKSAFVFSFVGTAAPTDLNDWVFEGEATKSTVDIEFPTDTAPGTLVWFTAQWKNPRGEPGPACNPVSTPLAGGAITETA